MSVLIVDWLGRGGIAQCTHALMDTLLAAARAATVVTVADRELGGPGVVAVPLDGNRIRRHRALALEAARVIRRERPDTVIVQNYVIPMLERPVADAANEVGAQLVWIVHDHQMHSLLAGNTIGFTRNLNRADVVVTHSRYVADRLPLTAGADVRVIPLPVPPEYHADPSVASLLDPDRRTLTALHFGVLKRQYKGTDLVAQLAVAGVRDWDFAAIGVGAPNDVDGLTAIPRFVDAAELAASVADAGATLLPYRMGTQSGAVAQSQFSGTVPIVSAVGGLPEQVTDGETGLLMAPHATAGEWADALRLLSDDETRIRMGKSCWVQAEANHRRFRSEVLDLVR